MPKNERALLVLLNGDLSAPACVLALARRVRGILCADGGARHAIALGLTPQFVVGDMDSLPRPIPQSWVRTCFWYDFSEDQSDFEKTLDFARQLGCPRVYVAGALGGRFDHILVNLRLIERYSQELDLVLVDSGNARLLKPGHYQYALKNGAIFSLISATPRACVTLSGARYPLKNAWLRPGSQGLSNVATGPIDLVVTSGRVWIVTNTN